MNPSPPQTQTFRTGNGFRNDFMPVFTEHENAIEARIPITFHHRCNDSYHPLRKKNAPSLCVRTAATKKNEQTNGMHMLTFCQSNKLKIHRRYTRDIFEK